MKLLYWMKDALSKEARIKSSSSGAATMLHCARSKEKGRGLPMAKPTPADPAATDDKAPQVNRKEAFRALLAYAQPHRKSFLIVFVCALLAISADLLQPYLVKIVIDNGLMSGGE